MSGDFLTPAADSFLKSDEASAAAKSSKSLSEVLSGDLSSYDAVFLPGGHGVVFDAPESAEL